ncbi:MAG: prolipoprotein diacylglyceryl transferase [Gemmataceae bacterium]|nr:prolipoprotein diacylglyceryl transferase [Gemmataceae bacterium]MCI0737740.1 prolipoprotein diacylglyceryl transferase [Gemmataceae bacterium]
MYPAIMGLAVATGYLVSRRTQRPLPLSPGQRLGLALGAFVGGMVGAKSPFLLMDFEGFLSGRAWLESGKTILVGLVGGYFGVEIAKWALHIQLKTGDTFAAPVAAAIAVGRLACFVGPCCFGTATDLPWGVDFGDGVKRHPTQLYEFAFHLSAALVLAQLQKQGYFCGQLIKLYIISYLGYRFVTEFIRPEPEFWLGLTIYQWCALVILPVFVWLWRRDSLQRDRLRFALAESHALIATSERES